MTLIKTFVDTSVSSGFFFFLLLLWKLEIYGILSVASRAESTASMDSIIQQVVVIVPIRRPIIRRARWKLLAQAENIELIHTLLSLRNYRDHILFKARVEKTSFTIFIQ